jgi:hypothetical protein
MLFFKSLTLRHVLPNTQFFRTYTRGVLANHVDYAGLLIGCLLVSNRLYMASMQSLYEVDNRFCKSRFARALFFVCGTIQWVTFARKFFMQLSRIQVILGYLN